ncbi:MAG: class I SAM-dependent methyltransferase [Betaproteobacteria bacterium]|nr:class I SAM-dependent methyltransferase [Betaproteobacteria bacterium]
MVRFIVRFLFAGKADMASTSNFDERAKTWDLDPAKVERALAVAGAIRTQVPLSTRMRALEYGCGTGLLGFALQSDLGHIDLADTSSGMLAVLNEKIEAAHAGNMRTMKLDLTVDSLPSQRYDLVFSMMAFHHIADIDRLLRSLHALFAAHGHLCVADLDAEDGSFHGAGFTGHNGFDRDDLKRRSIAAGFRNVRFSTAFHITKNDSPGQTDFPIFLMVAEK